MRKQSVAFLLAFVFALAFCAVPASAATTGATSIAFDNYSLILTSGTTHTLKVTISPSSVKVSDLEWRSDDTRVATVTNGTIYTKLNGGCIITATDPHTGVSASCYVGVGAPYGYVSYSPYYNNNYYQTFGYPYYGYDSNTNAIGTYIIPNSDYYAYYGSYTYPYYYYGYPYYGWGSSIPTYNNYYSSGYVSPGTASTAIQFTQEFKQGVEVRCNDERRGYGYAEENNRLVVIPDTTSLTETNFLQFPANILNRLSRYNFEAVQYNLPGLEIGIFPVLNKNVPTVLKVTGQPDTGLTKTINGPWKFEVNGEESGLQIRFILDRQYTKADLRLMMLNSAGKFVEVKRTEWKLTARSSGSYTIHSVVTELLPAGTYAITAQ